MRIGVLTTSYPRYVGDTAGSFVGGFVEALRRRGHEVDVLAPASRRSWPSYDPQLTQVPYMPKRWRFTFYGAGVPDNVRNPRAWPGLLSFPAALAWAGRGRDWDALVSHFAVPCALSASLIARGRPHLAVWHSADVRLAESVPGLAALARRAATRHWCVTAEAKTRLQLADDTIIAPMGATVEAMEPKHARLLLNENEHDLPVVLCLGRLVRIKGVDVLLRAMRDLPLRVWIAGDGPERGRLEQLARKMDVRARFFGEVHGEQKSALLAAADLFALPSRSIGARQEGAPVALLEAQLAGLPIIASQTGGIPERIRDQVDGILAKAEDESDWRRGLQLFLAGGMTAMGAKAQMHNAQFRWVNLAPRIEEALRP